MWRVTRFPLNVHRELISFSLFPFPWFSTCVLIVFSLYITSSRAAGGWEAADWGGGDVWRYSRRRAALSGGPARPQYSQQTGMSQSVLWPAVSASPAHMTKHTQKHTNLYNLYAKVLVVSKISALETKNELFCSASPKSLKYFCWLNYLSFSCR